MNWETFFIAIFWIIVVLVIMAVCIKAYLSWKLIKAIQNIPEEQKPFYGYSETARAIIVVVLVGLAGLGTYLKLERKSTIRSIRQDRALMARDELYNQQNPANRITSYQFYGSSLYFHQGRIFKAPDLGTTFCKDNESVLWNVQYVSSNAQYLVAMATCYTTTQESGLTSTDRMPRSIVIDLQQKIIVADNSTHAIPFVFGDFVTPTTIYVFIDKESGGSERQVYHLDTQTFSRQ